MSGPSAEKDVGLRVAPRRCEVCRRKEVPLRTTRGLFVLHTVERCVDEAACFAAWSDLTPGGSDA